jgi:RNA polymerase sigma factor (sigma-70 family)
MNAKNELFKHYPYIIKIVKYKTKQYNLDYDSTLNLVLEKLCDNDYKIIRAFRGESKFSTFITIVVNHMIFRFAKKKEALFEMPTIISETPLDLLIKQQKAKDEELFLNNLHQLFEHMDYEEKLILKMRFFKDLKISQISQITGLTRYQIQKKLDSGFEYLKGKIKNLKKN